MDVAVFLFVGISYLLGWCSCMSIERYSQENTTFARIMNDINTLEFCGYALAPRFTKTGIHVAQLPIDLKRRLRAFFYHAHTLMLKRPEPLNPFVWNNSVDSTNSSDSLLNFFGIDNDPSLKMDLESEIRSQIEAWTGVKTLVHTATFGIREYTRGSVLKPHVDRYRTHVLSAIVNVHQQVDQPWPLVVFDHNSERQHVYMNETTDVILYESATVFHGRPYPLKGDSFANVFLHFAPVGWEHSVAATIEACIQGTGYLCHDDSGTCAAASFNHYALAQDSFLVDACDHNHRRAFAFSHGSF